MIAQLTHNQSGFNFYTQSDSWLASVTNDGYLVSADLIKWKMLWKKSLSLDFAEKIENIAEIALIDDIIVLASDPGRRIFLIEAQTGKLHNITRNETRDNAANGGSKLR